MSPTAATALFVLSYLSGSVPWAVLVTRWVRGVDLRTVGSGNPGATNASRVLGMRWGLVILLADALKGAVPVLLLPGLFTEPGTVAHAHAAVLAALGAVLGHVFPVWLRFRGGKGVATGLGVAAVLHGPATLVAAGAFAVIAGTTRLVAVASTLAAAAFAAAAVLMPRGDGGPFSAWNRPLSAFAVAVAVLIAVRHASNFARLARGEDERFRGADLGAKPNGAKPGGAKPGGARSGGARSGGDVSPPP